MLCKLIIVVAIKISFVIVKITKALFAINVLSTIAKTITKAHLLVIETLSLVIAKTRFVIEIQLNLFLLLRRININFYLINDFIYYVKNDKTRLYISCNIKNIIIRAMHNNCFYASYYKVYVRLSNTIYIYKLSRKLIIYIRHYSQCQFNQTRCYRKYNKLMSLFTLFISFYIIVINFVLVLLTTNSQ